jgi:hypothetical protein
MWLNVFRQRTITSLVSMTSIQSGGLNGSRKPCQMTSLSPFCLINTQFLEHTSAGYIAKKGVKVAYSIGDFLSPYWARKYCSANTARYQIYARIDKCLMP